MSDIWKAALEWYMYYTDSQRKPLYAAVIMVMLKELRSVQSIRDLRERYPTERGTAERVVAEMYPGDWRLEQRTLEAAYALRCLELITNKKLDLRSHPPSLWLLETVA